MACNGRRKGGVRRAEGSTGKAKVLVSRVFHLVGKVDAKVVDRGLRDPRKK